MNKEKREILKNLKDFYNETAGLCSYEHGRFSGIDYVWNRKGNWPGYLFGKPDMKQAAEVHEEIRNHRLPPFWIMDTESDNGLVEYLESRDVRVIRKWKGMVMDLNAYASPVRQEDVELNLDLPGDVSSWRTLINEGLLSWNRMDEEIETALKKGGNFSWVVAKVDHTPVASGLLYTFQRVAGIYMIVTNKDFRGRGIGSLVTSALIDRALEKGIDRIILHATPMGERIYRKLGFVPINDISIFWKLGY